MVDGGADQKGEKLKARAPNQEKILFGSLHAWELFTRKHAIGAPSNQKEGRGVQLCHSNRVFPNI